MRSLLLAVVAAALQVAQPVQAASNFYWYIPLADAPNMDIEHLSGTIDELKAACDALANCTGFNSDGFLKTCVTGSCVQTSTCGLYVKHSTPMPAGLWPLPNSVAGMDGTALAADSTTFTITADSKSTSPVLTSAMKRYQSIFFVQKLPTPPLPPAPPLEVGTSGASTPLRPRLMLPVAEASVGGVVISVNQVEPPLQMGVNESYVLSVPPAGGTITIQAETTWGALRGLERLSQLAWWTGQGTQFTFFAATITDEPRFSHRGMLVDTSRHFLRVEALQMAIDSLVYNFYSVLHWHIVDDQAFPYESTTFPELSRQGAYNAPYTTHVYSQVDVQTVLSYAHDRGIRVLIEFDTPGHTQSWGISHPELLVPCYSGDQPNGARYGIHPLLNTTYDFMSKFWAEVATVFPDNYVHVGGDELSLGSGSCWTTNPVLQAWMKQNGQTDYAALENLYEQKFVKIVSGTGKSIIGWQELFDNGITLPDDFVVNVWKGGWQDEMAKVTQTFRTVLSSPYYENYIQNPYSNGGDWRQYYAAEPLNFTGSAAQKAKVMGCETSFWAEFIDATNLFSRAWPRAAASGERFWAAANVNDPDEAVGRLHAHRCRLVARGIPAEPVEGPSFCYDEYDVAYTPPF